MKRAQRALERSIATLARNAVVLDRAEHTRWEWRMHRLRAAHRPASVGPADDELLRSLLGVPRQVAQDEPGAPAVGDR